MPKSSGPERTFKIRLQTAREQRKFSQSELAERTGLQPSAVSHFETGRRSPSFENLKRLADALGVSTDYLLGRTAEPTGVGPAAQQFFRDLGRMTQADQDFMATIAKQLAEKNQAKQGKK